MDSLLKDLKLLNFQPRTEDITALENEGYKTLDDYSTLSVEDKTALKNQCKLQLACWWKKKSWIIFNYSQAVD